MKSDVKIRTLMRKRLLYRNAAVQTVGPHLHLLLVLLEGIHTENICKILHPQGLFIFPG